MCSFSMSSTVPTGGDHDSPSETIQVVPVIAASSGNDHDQFIWWGEPLAMSRARVGVVINSTRSSGACRCGLPTIAWRYPRSSVHLIIRKPLPRVGDR